MTTILGEGVESQVFVNTEEPNLVTMITTNYAKCEFIKFLGLVTKPANWFSLNGTDAYELSVVRLNRIEDNEQWFNMIYCFKIVPEVVALAERLHYLRCRYSSHDDIVEALYNERENFPIHRAAIEFAYEYRKTYTFELDTHQFNYLFCPITEHIYPYDAFFWIELRRDDDDQAR